MVGQRIGYIRVSTLDQHTERQLDGIEVDKTFTDKASGKDTKRPQLELMMNFVHSGDTVIVHSMDRLARNLDDPAHDYCSRKNRYSSIPLTTEISPLSSW
jgi:DNA invertase Pin-like site-specific DNA recombinase